MPDALAPFIVYRLPMGIAESAIDRIRGLAKPLISLIDFMFQRAIEAVLMSCLPT
ncbi:MAG: hypothetical protein QNI96_15070 [Woeseiaceae bacterium]|nr:hypothetical protein [Woeseiaceae bacterium]